MIHTFSVDLTLGILLCRRYYLLGDTLMHHCNHLMKRDTWTLIQDKSRTHVCLGGMIRSYMLAGVYLYIYSVHIESMKYYSAGMHQY